MGVMLSDDGDRPAQHVGAAWLVFVACKLTSLVALAVYYALRDVR